MRHIKYADSDQYPIALLIKSTAFIPREIENGYVKPLGMKGIPAKDLITVSAEYDTNGKAPVKFIKEYLIDNVLPDLASIGCKYIYVADSNYFKVLAGVTKAEPNLGDVLPCKLKGYEHLSIILGINQRAILYNPTYEAKLELSLDTLASVVGGIHIKLGANIIQQAYYPEGVQTIADALKELHQYSDLSCDIEAFSLDFDKAGIGTIAFAWNMSEGVAFKCDLSPLAQPVDKMYSEYIPNDPVRALLKEFFTTYKGTLRWHRANYDLTCIIYPLWMDNLLDNEGLLTGLSIMAERFHDTRIIAYLATNTTAGNSLSLKDLAHEFAGNWAQEDIKDIRKIPVAKLLQYNLVDTLSTNYVFNKFYPKMVEDEQEELYYSLMIPSQRDIIQVELTGMPLCPNRVQDVKQQLEVMASLHEKTILSLPIIKTLERELQQRTMEAANAKLKTKQHSIEHFAGLSFNPNSGPQKQMLVYDLMGLPVTDLTKAKQPSTKGKVLRNLINHTDDPAFKEVLQALVDHSEVTKILSSFIPAFERAIDKGDGLAWLHGSFNLGGTKSGRLSSSDPNLQNLPSGSTYGKLIKSCFKAPAGWLMVGADFNGLEDCVNTLLTNDPNKEKVLIEGYDGHSLRAYNYWPDKFPDIKQIPDNSNERCYKANVDGTDICFTATEEIEYEGKCYTGTEFAELFTC